MENKISNIGLKAATNFRKKYKTLNDLNLRDFIIYAIIRGKDPISTVIDSNYEEGKNPIKYNFKYKNNYFELYLLSEEMKDYLLKEYNTFNFYFGSERYVTMLKTNFYNRIKYLFDLDEEEIRLVIENYLRKISV